MTITEAKKIIEMCADAIKKDNDKIYVNKEYVLQILDMVETVPSGFQPGIEPITTPVWPPTWPQVWYKDSTGEPEKPESPGPGFEKVPWWVWYKNPFGDFTCDINSSGSKPQDANVVVTSEGGHVDDATRYANMDSSMYRDTGVSTTLHSKMDSMHINDSEPIHQFKEKFTTSGPIKDVTDGTHAV